MANKLHIRKCGQTFVYIKDYPTADEARAVGMRIAGYGNYYLTAESKKPVKSKPKTKSKLETKFFE